MKSFVFLFLLLNGASAFANGRILCTEINSGTNRYLVEINAVHSQATIFEKGSEGYVAVATTPCGSPKGYPICTDARGYSLNLLPAPKLWKGNTFLASMACRRI